jgi:broad specificity phosphatase PhoE
LTEYEIIKPIYKESLMEIVLLRHGRPLIDRDISVSAAGFGQWVERYDNSGVDGALPPPPETCKQARRCAVVVCSDLPRSVQSAEALGVDRVDRMDHVFREMEMPFSLWPVPRMSPSAWATVFRVLWVLGFSPHAESYRQAKRRALACTKNLVDLAGRYGSVLLVGHGMLNWHIAKHLLRQGWTGLKHKRQLYWDYSIFLMDTDIGNIDANNR